MTIEDARGVVEANGGQQLASAIASDDGTIENVSSYPIEGDWGEDVHFILVGNESRAEGATDFKLGAPPDPATAL